MNFNFTEITNKSVVTRPESGQHGLTVNSNPYLFGPERNISYGWNWLGDSASEIWTNRNMAHYAFGSVCVGRHDELYYVFRKGFSHGVNTTSGSEFYQVGGDLYYTVSYDSGETWADPVMFLEHTSGYDLRDVTLSYYPEHDMYVLIYNRSSVPFDSPDRINEIHVLSTPNLARPQASDTVKEPFPITNMSEWTLPTSDMFTNLNATFNRLIPLGSSFYLPFYGADAYGDSWGAGILRFGRGVVGNPTSSVLKKWDGDGSNESSMFFTFVNDSIRMNILFRGGNGSGDNATLSYSDDFGETWSAKTELGFTAAGGPQVFDINGTFMLVARAQDAEYRHYIYAIFSRDGVEWSNKVMLSSLDVSYASLAQLNNGKTLLFYAKELSKSIICMREVYAVPAIPIPTAEAGS